MAAEGQSDRMASRGSVHEAKVWNLIPSCGKKWHTLTFIDAS